ncbi:MULTISPECIES: DUF1471 domain-containing protein [Buttiauxella]|jgi:hypothetical protein|uniref:YdgH/BhsA/McbA-like domain-containing protein n=1 Tax=Buttiauxella ferragutiae ATCC 51602 TaxID=1354252 RepID=A0ABX2WBA6_9ENTR|nr:MULTISPECIES: DUF1471 domain-containing protein [Buttiauxella]AYN28462.1 DUF1471 domain-containing protein [Buttiauxella sp. 3AFRM03]MCE0828951.1 DUF1471 domain-containing protein [Buttiauxella ferragutiae]OAT30119.1 hypothetical protein M976_01128 [Buttiauxella ferragutiae ATCC 51602]TDN52754.1 uncharacterized protein DUF1471 [Buttiauxella sp. JUb87]UNK61595.1 DUF1471 domain-containing protein [Buttiauxella ferragutiae]
MIRKTAALTMLLFSISFSASSATEIKNNEAKAYQEIGHISVSGKPSSEEAVAAIKTRAEESGADYFSIVRLTTPGDSSKWSANAVLYKSQ